MQVFSRICSVYTAATCYKTSPSLLMSYCPMRMSNGEGHMMVLMTWGEVKLDKLAAYAQHLRHELCSKSSVYASLHVFITCASKLSFIGLPEGGLDLRTYHNASSPNFICSQLSIKTSTFGNFSATPYFHNRWFWRMLPDPRSSLGRAWKDISYLGTQCILTLGTYEYMILRTRSLARFCAIIGLRPTALQTFKLQPLKFLHQNNSNQYL